jgi:hypothetical protein
VDTNVRRVLGRIAVGGGEALAPAAMQALADDAVPAGRSRDWTHALMDVGALLCLPRRPLCADCPAVPWCRYAAGDRLAPAAGPAGSPARSRPAPAFPDTRRWLRGRIMDRARDAGGDDWVPFPGEIGSHGSRAVREAILALAGEGLLETRDTPEGPKSRLPR